MDQIDFMITCGKCGETAVFKEGEKPNGEIDIVTNWDDEIQIWCDKCNEYIII